MLLFRTRDQYYGVLLLEKAREACQIAPISDLDFEIDLVPAVVTS